MLQMKIKQLVMNLLKILVMSFMPFAGGGINNVKQVKKIKLG